MTPPAPSLVEDIRSSPGYIGRADDFLLSTSWVSYDNVETLFNAQCVGPLTCYVIGTLVADGLRIEPHGDFIPPGDMKQAFMHFSLRSPQAPHSVRQEFEIGIANLQTLAGIHPKDSTVSGLLTNHWTDETQDIFESVLNFKHKIFARKVSFIIMKFINHIINLYMSCIIVGTCTRYVTLSG